MSRAAWVRATRRLPWSDYFERVHSELIFADLTDDYIGVTGYYSTHFPRVQPPVAPSYHGPWTVQGDPHPGDVSRTSFHSQISCVFKHPAKEDLYIAMADRWLPHYLEDSSAAIDFHIRAFSPDADPGEAHELLTEVNTSLADYVWLPIRFDGDRPIIDWHDEWRVEDYA